MPARNTLSRKVLKAISIFGTVQVITMLCSVIRAKCVAMWMGAAGIGLFALLNQATDMLTKISELNIRESGVQAIVKHPGRRDFISTVVSKLSLILGLSGSILTLVLAPLLGRLTYGESGHETPFVILSVVVFLRVIIAGKQSILQAHDKLKRLASASLWGNLAGTLISIILFRLFGLDGIVPSIVVFAIVTWIAYLGGKKAYIRQTVSAKSIIRDSTPIVKLGIYMTVAAFISSLSSYIFLVWLRNNYSEDEVGYYQAGFTIISQYVGLMFAAISVEFYPRVASVIDSTRRTSIYVMHEVNMLQWLLVGCVVIFELLSPVIVRILYSDSFADVAPYLLMASVGTSLRAYSVILAYIIIARGDGKIYIVTESISSLLYIVLNMTGYTIGGLYGAGIAYSVWYLVYAIIMTVVYRYRYGYIVSWKTYALTGSVISVLLLEALTCQFYSYSVSLPIAVIIVLFSLAAVYKIYFAGRLKRKKTVKYRL